MTFHDDTNLPPKASPVPMSLDAALRGRRSNDAASAPLPSDALIIVPVRNTVLFPGTVAPLTVGRPQSIAAAQRAVREQRPVGILMQRDAEAGRTRPRRHAPHRARSPTSCATSPRPTARTISSARAMQRFRVARFLPGCAVPASPAALHIPEPDRKGAGDRGAVPAPAEPGRRGAASCCRRRRRSWCQTVQQAEHARRSSPISRPPTWTSSPRRSRRSSRPSTCSPRMDKVSQHPRPAHRGAAHVAARSAGRPRRRSTSASARPCCASRWRRSSASSARATARPRRSPS